jgi:hypothetical protein
MTFAFTVNMQQLTPRLSQNLSMFYKGELRKLFVISFGMDYEAAGYDRGLCAI